MRSSGKLTVAGVAVAGVLLGGCGTGSGSGLTPGPDGNDSALARFYGQKPDWRPCPADEVPKPAKGEAGPPRFECTTVTVPLDYRHPGGKTIKLALNRLPATDPGHRIGSLLTNPGGPGISGLDYVYQDLPQQFSSGLRARYDAIGMDPRGVGRSSPVRCLTVRQLTRLRQQRDPDEAARAFAESCEKKSGALLPHLGTDNVARDLDVVRAVLGEDKLDYLGFSYGTVIGQFYAQQFPRRVGRMVLDSVANPATTGDPATRAIAFDTALGVFAQSCADKGNCPLGSRRGAVLNKIDDLADRVRSKPLPGGPGNPPIGADALAQALEAGLGQEDSWPALAKALAAASDGDGKPLGALINSGQDGNNDDDATGGNIAVDCLHRRPAQREPRAVKESLAEVRQVAPVFGDPAGNAAFGLRTCAAWPAPSIPQAGRAMTAPDAPTVLLVNNLYDPATPVTGARSVEGQLAKATLTTNASGGHIFYTKGRCTRRVVDNYLLAGHLPPPNTTCHDRTPGTPHATP